MVDLHLTLACGDYDWTGALLDGRVGVNGCRLDATAKTSEELFPLAVGPAPFDITEMSFSSYLMQVDRGEGAYVAIPAFVSRAFRHGGIYVRTDRNIETPKDLEGRLVGIPEYQMTMGLWVRGILQDEYGVDFKKIKYRTGGTNKSGRKERLPLELPRFMDVETVAEGRSLNDLLLAGDLDAVIAPTPPNSFLAEDGRIRRLFADAPAAERDYYKKTGIFPIMHAVGVRRSLVAAHPGLAARVFQAFLAARALADGKPEKGPYGVAENSRDLGAAIRYSNEQFLVKRRLSKEEIFAPELLEIPGN